MKTWTRAAHATICGQCGHHLHRGDPLLVFQLPELTRRHQRCATCAGEPVPLDLPALVVHKTVSELAPMVPARVLAKGTVLPFDYTMRLLGDREPGEDDE